MKKLIILCFICVNLSPAWGQLFTPKQIREIQDFYAQHPTLVEKAIEEGEELIPPYSLPAMGFGNTQRPKDFQPYFQANNKEISLADNTLRDTLRFDGKDILIFDSPLLDFEEITKIVLPNKITAIAFGGYPYKLNAYRGYTALWSIENDSLFLLRVTPYHEGEYFNGDSVAPEVMYPEIEELTGQRFIRGKLFANWVNGRIVGGTDGVYLQKELDQYELKWYSNYTPERILRKRYTGHYLYPEEYSFWIENGILIQTDHLQKE